MVTALVSFVIGVLVGALVTYIFKKKIDKVAE